MKAVNTIDAYNKNADKYAAKFMDFESYREKIRLFQRRYLPEGSTVFDVGCGPGNNAAFLMNQDTGYQIEGIDLSIEMVNLAKINAPECSFMVHDIRGIEPDKAFDAIIASFCIVHLSHEETAILIHKFSNMLKKNGSLYLSFMEGKNAGYETTTFSENPIFFNYYDRGVVSAMLEENRISVIDLFSEPYQETDGSVTEDIFIFGKRR